MMEDANLPVQKAREPDEEAHQPEHAKNASRMSLDLKKQKHNNVTFAEATESTEKSASQRSSAFEASQPPANFSHRQRLVWLQERRKAGLWANCDRCHKWRRLPHIIDCHELPREWYCKLNTDKSFADCSVSEEPLRARDEEDLIYSVYSAGSVVWARVAGWPWWPAMVDDCPDTEQFYWLDGFSDIPTHYNVSFFDSADTTRAWVAPAQLMPYGPNKDKFKYLLKDKRHKKRLQAAIMQADDANSIPLSDRLAKYSFISTYPGAINDPRKINKEIVKKFQNKLKKIYDITSTDSSASDSDDNVTDNNDNPPKKAKRNNVIILGTPKSAKTGTPKKIKSKHFDVELKEPEQVTSSNIKTDDTVVVSNETGIPKEDKDNEIFKEPNSMAVLVGSTDARTVTVEMETASYDNDTSKTYAPGSESESETIPIRVRMSPSSEDFDFE